jgi:hypothetical protein
MLAAPVMSTPNPLPTDPTPYPDVNAVLRLLLEGVRVILGADLVGLYLYGSLSSGDFDPVSSDIDFLVVTARELSGGTLAALHAMHMRIAASGLPWATKLEGSYIPRTALRRHDRANARHPSIGVDWDFGIGQHGSDWVIQRHIIREQGVVVWGPPPRTLIDPVKPDELRTAATDTVLDFWAAQEQGPEPEWLRPRAYQAFAILTMCRALYTVERGEVASKPVAAAWACAALGRRWSPLVERALTWRHDARPDDMTEMINFIHYTVERCRQARRVR